jgi:hypothetical protein
MIERIHQLVKRSNTAPQSVIELLKETLIGTEGALYQLLDTESKINDLVQPNFIYLERNNKAIANVTICERPIKLNNENFQALYLRYFAFDRLFQSGKKDTARAQNGNSGFQTYFEELFKTSNFDPVNPEFQKSIYWGYIDPQNRRSFKMNEKFGFQTIGDFKTWAFSRVNPKMSEDIFRIKETEKEDVLKKLRSFYTDFQFYSEVHLFDNNDFFIAKVNGEIVAGIQANPVHWKIRSLPGLSGKLMVKFAHKIPRIKKLINPKNHQFLATEGLFWKTGFEHKVPELLESVLAIMQKNSLLIWQDTLNNQLVNLPIKWGFIQKSKKNNAISIVAKFNGFSNSEIDQIRTSRKYLSGFDMT